MTMLLDRTDSRKRLLQHGGIFGAIGLLLVAGALVDAYFWPAVALIAIAAALFVAASRTFQEFGVTYQGHSILLKNNPFRGEKLFVDGIPVAKGRIGVTSVMRAALDSGDEVLVRTDAGLVRFRCRIEVVRRSVRQA